MISVVLNFEVGCMKETEKIIKGGVQTYRQKGKDAMKSLWNKSVEKGSEIAAASATYAKEGISLAERGIKYAAGAIVEGSKEAQKKVLAYVDEKKNSRFLKTKLQSFEDGMKEGKYQAVDYIKKYANFCLAATALSFYFACCDGDISEEELLEIQFDLDGIMKNKDLPDELKNRLAEISLNRKLDFNEVKKYLDGVGNDTVLEFRKDVDEIIFADSVLTDSEKEAKQAFEDYLNSRLAGE